MAIYYDFIDNADFLKARQKRAELMYTEFDRLCAERDHFYRKLFFKAYCIANGNISAMARGLGYTRSTLMKYLKQLYSDDYRTILEGYVRDMKLEIK